MADEIDDLMAKVDNLAKTAALLIDCWKDDADKVATDLLDECELNLYLAEASTTDPHQSALEGLSTEKRSKLVDAVMAACKKSAD